MNNIQPEQSSDDPSPIPSRVWVNCMATSGVAVAAWIPCEVLGGLFFLSLGIRLWNYHIAPICWELTSLVGWALLLPILGSQCCVYLLWERRARIAGAQRWFWRAGFLMVSGPLNEIFWNTLIWSAFDRPLYLYTVLPTFGGSGSLLSPLYYVTLLAGFWLDERIPGTLAYRWCPANSSLDAKKAATEFCPAILALADSNQEEFVDAEAS